jgi:hypothetical protein
VVVESQILQLVIQSGSFGLLAAIVLGVGYYGRQVASRLVSRLDIFLSRIEAQDERQNEILARMQDEQAKHYLADSYEQRDIRDVLIRIENRVVAEHTETRRVLMSAIDSVGRHDGCGGKPGLGVVK